MAGLQVRLYADHVLLSMGVPKRLRTSAQRRMLFWYAAGRAPHYLFVVTLRILTDPDGSSNQLVLIGAAVRGSARTIRPSPARIRPK